MRKDEWLTRHLQNQAQASDRTTFTHRTQTAAPTKRRANPKLLLMGMRRCGKSSVQKVVFQKLPPADTLYLEPTQKLEHTEMLSFLHVFSTEVPSQLPVLSPDFDHAPLFTDTGAVIWIIDSQDEYLTSISQLLRTAIFLAENYPSTNLEVFIHKTDGLSDEYKHETFREVRQRVQDELSDYGYGDRAVSYYQTSIFDHSILEATSKVLHKLLPTFPPTETLLTKLCSTCRIQKCYLFDTVSKIYVATDASPTFLKDYEACSDYIDLVVDIKQLYSWQDESATSSSSNTSESMGESTVTYDPSGDTYIYAREICKNLSLVCLMGNEGNSPEQKHLVDHNVNVVHEALVKIFRVSSVWSSLSEREGEDSSGEQESDGG